MEITLLYKLIKKIEGKKNGFRVSYKNIFICRKIIPQRKLLRSPFLLLNIVVELNLDWASLIVLSNLPPTKLYIYLEDLKEKLIYLKQQSRLL